MPSTKLPTRQLGRNGPDVTAIGFGAMGLSAFYGEYPPEEERQKVFDRAYEIGETFWDSAAGYGDSEELIGRWFKRTGKRDEIFLATKFTYPIPTESPDSFDEDKTAEIVYAACDKALTRLGINSIDLWYLHRVAEKVPIERTVLAMRELQKQGKIKHIGLSEVSATTLRRASRIAKIAAVQMEYSPFALEIESPETKLLETARELGVAIVAYSPLGRGLFADRFKKTEELDKNDWRRLLPKFQGDNFEANQKLTEAFKELAEKKGATVGQVTLAWILAQGDDIIPIPGTKRIPYLEENVAALKVELTAEEVKGIRDYIQKLGSVGCRFIPGDSWSVMFADTKDISEEEKQLLSERSK